MPLADHAPAIDTRTFDDIMAEVKARIARYTPEWKPVWTDYNDSDPGITLVQLFAWLTEMLIYRLGQVPDLNYIKFLQLLNIELQPAEPATTEITFPVAATTTVPVVDVPLHTQVSAQGADGSPVVFETERAIHALAAPLNSVQTNDGGGFRNVVQFDGKDPAGFEPFGGTPGRDMALYLGFASPQGGPATPMPSTELDLCFWSAGTNTPTSVSCAPGVSSHSSATLAWEYLDTAGWQSLSVLLDETLSLARTGHVRLRLPPQGAMTLSALGAAAAHYWIRARITRAAYEKPPRLLAVRTNTVAATQAESVVDEVLGGSDGSRNQTFMLAHHPVVHGSLALEIDEGSGFEAWTRVDDFYSSGSNDRHYLLNRTSGEIRLGDGINGHVPAANAHLPGANVVARAYRFGGGPRGNVLAGAISTLITGIIGIDANAVGNLLAATGGQDEETLESAKLRAPRSLRSRGRAVTAEDFEQLASCVAGIRRAKTLPLHHPGFPGVQVPGAVSVIVVPDAETKGPNRVDAPMPSEGTLRNVCSYLNQARLVSTELFVLPPTYQRVSVCTQVVARPDADLAALKVDIENALWTYFHPLIGGEDGAGWAFGDDIAFSRVFQRIALPGVLRVDSAIITVDGRETPACTNIPICDGVLPYSVSHDVQVEYGTSP